MAQPCRPVAKPDPLDEPVPQQGRDLANYPVVVGQLQGEVTEVVAVPLAPRPRIREHGEDQNPPPHAGLGPLRAAIIRAPTAAAVERIRSTSAASAASPAAVIR